MYTDDCICGEEVGMVVSDNMDLLLQDDNHVWIRCSNCGHINWVEEKTHAEKVAEGRTYDRR